MIKFKSIKMINFMSYGAVPTMIQLDQPGTTLLLGEDLDATSSGAGSNGVGKSSILNAIVYAIYDQPLSSDIATKDDLVNHINKKQMEVSVEFEKSGITYIITRCRKMKVGASGNYTTIYENGKDITLDSSNNTNAQIEKIIGIPYELFVRIVAFSAEQISFLKLPVRSAHAANQTDIIEELFELKTLSEKAESLKIEIKDTESSLKTQLERVETLKGEHERHTKQLESAKRRVVTWEQTNTSEIEDVKWRIERLDNINVEEQRALLQALQENRETIIIPEQNISNEMRKETQSLQQTARERAHELEHLKKGTCPFCKQDYKIATDKYDTIVAARNVAIDRLEIVTNQFKNSQNVLNENDVFVRETEKKLQVKNLEELLFIDNKRNTHTQKLTELIAAANPYMEVLEELEAVVLDTIDMTKINELKSLLDHQTFLLKLLTKKDSFVRKALLNKNIPFLNQRLQKYLADMELPHHVEFTHEMTASISKFGHTMSFGNLSHGQKARVNLALSFAFRDVLQSMHDTVNICMLDEVLDEGLDAVGVQAAAKMLKRKARDEKLALYIISHKDEIDNAFDRKLIVQMSNGFSSIRYEDG